MMSLLEWILVAACAFSAGYTVISTALVRRWLSAPTTPLPATGEPVTFFRPIKSGVPGLERRLRLLLASCDPGDQVLLGTSNPDDTALCHRVMDEWPAIDATVIECDPGLHANPKINKLAQLEGLAKHARWICSDSELAPAAGSLDRFRAEWQECGADAISAPYRFADAGGWIDRADANACALTLWPGAAVLRAFGKIDFLTGGCFGVRAEAMQRCGGFAAFGDALAEDNRIGRAIAARGGKVALASATAAIDSDGLGLRGWLLHQHRVARTYFLCDPAGYAGLPLTFGLPAALAGIAFGHAPWVWLACTGGLWMMRSCSALLVELALGTPLARAWAPLCVLAASLVEAAAWIAGLLPLPVWWAGRWWRA